MSLFLSLQRPWKSSFSVRSKSSVSVRSKSFVSVRSKSSLSVRSQSSLSSISKFSQFDQKISQFDLKVLSQFNLKVLSWCGSFQQCLSGPCPGTRVDCGRVAMQPNRNKRPRCRLAAISLHRRVCVRERGLERGGEGRGVLDHPGGPF